MTNPEQENTDPTVKNPLKGGGKTDSPVTLDSAGNPKQDVVVAFPDTGADEDDKPGKNG